MASVSPLVPQAAIEDVWFHAQEDLENSASTANTTTFTDYVTTHSQGLGASENKTYYIIQQGEELTCLHFFKWSC